MAGQQQQIAETIFNLKRKLRAQDDEFDSDHDPSASSYHLTRNYSLKRKAPSLPNGVPEPVEGPPTYKRKLEHAGYKRYVISRNPLKFDIDGDIVEEELEEDEEDEDITTLEDDPYADIRLEQLLAPLTSAAELPNHPSLSVPYLTKHLTTLADDSRKISHKEQISLWKAKDLLTKLLGDDAWAPLGIMMTDLDKAILEGNISKDINGGRSLDFQELILGDRMKLLPPVPSPKPKDATDEDRVAPVGITNGRPNSSNQNGSTPELQGQVKSSSESLAVQKFETERPDAIMENGTESHSANSSNVQNGLVHVNGTSHSRNGIEQGGPVLENSRSDQSDTNMLSPPEGDSPSDSTSQPAAHRMTTRARANITSKTPSPPASPTQSTPPIHPFFEFPRHILPDPDLGLPPAEAEETRLAVFALVQKQEEITRNSLELFHGMLQADRLRTNIFSWAKAEGHVGEMSDGEDWYDKDEWGLEDDLVKGREEEDEDAGTSVKKTRQRRGAKEDK